MNHLIKLTDAKRSKNVLTLRSAFKNKGFGSFPAFPGTSINKVYNYDLKSHSGTKIYLKGQARYH